MQKFIDSTLVVISKMKNDTNKVILLCDVSNAYYSIVKHYKTVDAKKYLLKFKVLVNILPLDDKAIELALASDFGDFEDGLQYFVAMDYDSDILITRNKKDFKSSKIPVMTAGEYLKR